MSWWEKVTFWYDDDDDAAVADDIHLVLDQHAELNIYSASTMNNSPRVGMSLP
jgi:hypothetical protein